MEVLAFGRHHRVVLAVRLPPDAARSKPGQVLVQAEDGARFPIPDDQILGRWSGLASAADGLAALRRRATVPIGWDDAHSRAAAAWGEGTAIDLVSLTLAAEAPDAALAGLPAEFVVAVLSEHAEPWFRRDGTSWIVVPRATALERLAAAEARQLAEQEDAAFRAWWPARSRSLPAAGMAGALAAVRDFALAGDRAATDRGRKLLGPFDLAEPDLALEALVAAGVLGDDANPAPHRCGLSRGFSPAALDAARAAVAAALPTDCREDLTGVFSVSVDAPETTEVDDALSARIEGDDVEVLVHIADADSAIAKDGPLDRAASERGSSLYLPETAVSMLPSALVTERLSLDVGAVRAAVTGFFLVGSDGVVKRTRFARTLIRVTRRLSYDDTRNPSVLAESPEIAARIVEAASALRAARIRGGALVPSFPSLDVHAWDGVPQLLVRRQDTPGDLVVAECAVLYNAQAGAVLAAAGAAALFRTQGPPRPPPAADSPLRDVLERRRFAPTHLLTEAGRHHGVGADAYVQCTSPMRRFADLVNQRQLLAVADGAASRPYTHADLERLAERISAVERAVRNAAGEREDHWVAKAWLPRVGTEIEGLLVRAPRRGQGQVWVDELLRELPLRVSESWTSPPEGTRGRFRVSRVLPWRGRIELSAE